MSNQRYSVTIDVGADITKARAAMADLQKIFNTQNLGAGQSNKITSMFSDLSKALDELESKSGKTFSSLGKIKGIDKTKDKVSSLISDIAREFTKLEGMGDTELGKNFKGLADNLEKAGAAFKTYEGAISKIKSRQNDLSKYIEKTTKEYNKQNEARQKYESFRKDFFAANPSVKRGIQQVGIRDYLTNQLEEKRIANEKAQQELNDYINQKGYASNAITRTGAVRSGQTYSEDNELIKLAENAKNTQEALDGVSNSLKNFTNITKDLKSPADLDKIKDSLKQAKEELANLTSGKLSEEAFNNLKTSLGQIFGEDLFKDIQNSENAVEQFKEKINSISADKLSGLKQQFPEIASALEKMGSAAQHAGEEINNGMDVATKAQEMGREIDALGSRLKYFFSLAGGFNLMRRAIRSAVTTTKELDAVMTQTAVVSQYTVGDMWKTLPQYSKEAKKLGAAIKDVYSAQTLYVQQGLNMNDAMDLGVETLKMARVAGINAEEATNSMTAALRGFNMELNESSAVRINDVYSKLAQNTASNVQEISTAMTKTAALANSANMSFENTAAFLATIIESTREGAETAGTALKTVIARFTEVKKLYDEGELTGTDEEGQEVDVNKISKALRTAGINMNDFFTGAKGLDEIFIELGSKWDSLTTVQQRYIATMAAGSRQQSRFLALMQNYNRTLQLSNMAYNSAGSGQEQFEKTLDSLEAKLNKLKDEWDTFIMGIANNDLIKGFVDAGTAILETINKIINAISGGNGLVKSVTSIATAFGVFKIGGAVIKKGLGNVGQLFTGGGKDKKSYFDQLQTQMVAAAKGSKVQTGFNFVGRSLVDKLIPIKYIENQANTAQQVLADNFNKNIIPIYEKRKEKFGEEDAEKYLSRNKEKYYQDQQKEGLNQKQADQVLKTGAYKQAATDADALANSAMLAGGAILGLTTILESSGKISKKAAGIWKGVGAAILAFGGALKVTTVIMKTFSKEATIAITSIPFIGWALAATAAITALGVALNNTFSIQAKSKAASDFADSVKTAADEAKQELQSIQDKIEEIGNQQNAFDGLIIGTTEWDTAVQNLNQSILELIQLYPELAGAVEYVDGHLSLNTKSKEYQDWIEGKKQEVANKQVANEAATYRKNRLNAEAEVTGNLWQMADNQPAVKVFKEGLQQRLSKVESEVAFNLLEAIHDGSIVDSTTLETYLKGVKEDQANLIREAFSEEQYIGNDKTLSAFRVDYTDRFIKAESLRNKTQNRGNFIASATNFIEENGLNKSDYSNMWLAIAEQQISDIMSGVTELDEKDIRVTKGQTTKADYAALMGKTIKETSDEDYNEYIKLQAAKSKVNIPQELQGLNEDQLAQAQALITGQYEKLTLDQLKGLQQIEDSFYNLVEEYATIPEEVARNIYGNLFKGYEQFQPSIEKIASTTGQVEQYEKTTDVLRKQGVSNEGIQEIFSVLGGVLDDISDPKIKENAQSFLSAIDFSSRDSIRKGIQQIKDLGIVIEDNLVDKLIDASKATKQFNEAKLKEKLEGISKATDLVEKIQSGETTLTEDEYNQLKENIVDFNEEDWVNDGFDKWTYIGNNTNSLLAAIDNSVAQIAGDMRSELQDSVDKGEKIKASLNKTFVDEDGGITDSLENIIANWSKAVAENENIGKLRTGMSKEFLDIFRLSNNAIIQDVIEAYNQYYGLEGNALAINKEQYNAFQEKYGTQLAGSLTSGQSVLNQVAAQQITEEDASKVLKAAVQGLGTGEEYMVQKDIVELGEQYEDVLNALAVDANKASKNFDNLTQAYKDNASALTTDKKGTREYGIALANLTKSVKAAYGNSEIITEDFVEQNLELFENYSNGVEGSAEAIRNVIAQKMIETGANVDLVNTALTALDGTTFNINGNADFSNVFNSFAATEQQANALAEVLRSLGYTVELKMGEAVYDPISGEAIGYNWEAVVNNTSGQAEVRNRGGGGGGGGGGGKEFKNDFDKYYNQVEDINELERQRNLLEKDYDQLLKSESKSGKDIYDNLKKQLQLLEERRKLTADLAEKRKQQIIDTTKDEEFKSVSKYAWWNESDLTIEIDWDAINKIKDSEEGDLVKEYVKKLEDFQGKYDDMIEQLEDIESTVQEIKERGQKEYQSLEDRTRDALIKQIQDEIDELTDVDQAIKDANQRLFDSISQTLELQRQERSNAKTEEELSDKEKRLAYLQQDSSNANQVEIARLQKEIDDARQDYTDNLIDQKISELQRQNDEAADQRQQQIDLMQHSLDWQEKSGAFWQEVYRLISLGTDATGALIHQSDLENVLKGSEGWEALSQEGKMAWLEELEDLVAQGFAYLEMGRQLEDIGTKAGSSITFTNANGQKLTGTVDKNGNVVVKNSDGSTTTYKDVFQDYSGAFRTFETEGEAKAAPKPTTGTSKPSTGSTGSTTTTSSGQGTWNKVSGTDQYNYLSGDSHTHSWTEKNSATGKTRTNSKTEGCTYVQVPGAPSNIRQCRYCKHTKETSSSKVTYNPGTDSSTGLLPKQIKRYAYATGGLNTKSGIAWLDGTASAPELVLNARDTENFIQLKDTLASIKSGGGLSLAGGDNYYDIKVQVDQMSSDYDVDRAIDRIKARIAQDGAYRNVNTLSRLR